MKSNYSSLFEEIWGKTIEKRSFRLANYDLEIGVIGSWDTTTYFRSMSHLNHQSDGKGSKLKISIIECKSSGIYPPEGLLNWGEIDPYNGELRNFSEGYFAVNNTAQLSFILIDYKNNRICYWVNDFEKLPPNEIAAPLRVVLTLWFRQTSFFLCHAAGICFGEYGVLLTGKGGMGKSTAVLSCLNSNMGYAGDDFLLVDSENCVAYSLYNVAKLNYDQFSLFPKLNKNIANKEYLPKEKGHVYINELYPAEIKLSFKIKSIFLPSFSGLKDSSLVSCGKVEVLKALLPSSIWILRGKVDGVLPMRKIIDRLDSYKLNTGTELSQIPVRIKCHLNEN